MKGAIVLFVVSLPLMKTFFSGIECNFACYTKTLATLGYKPISKLPELLGEDDE